MKLLVDGNSIFNVAYHAMQKEGEPPQYVALNLILDVMKMHAPNHFEEVAICWDSLSSFRKMLYPQYKANRKPKPDDYYGYLLRTDQLFVRAGLSSMVVAGYEADDIIATLSAEPGHWLIYSGDRDLMQLIEPGRVGMLYSKWSKANGREKILVETDEQVREIAGAIPSQLADYKALVGDTSDNIPGVKGIGSVTAKTLLERFDDLEEIYTSKRYRMAGSRILVRKLDARIADAFLFRTLVTLYKTAPGIKDRDLTAPTVDEIHKRIAIFKEVSSGREG